jgi:hypothetical protein
LCVHVVNNNNNNNSDDDNNNNNNNNNNVVLGQQKRLSYTRIIRTVYIHRYVVGTMLYSVRACAYRVGMNETERLARDFIEDLRTDLYVVFYTYLYTYTCARKETNGNGQVSIVVTPIHARKNHPDGRRRRRRDDWRPCVYVHDCFWCCASCCTYRCAPIIKYALPCATCARIFRCPLCPS